MLLHRIKKVDTVNFTFLICDSDPQDSTVPKVLTEGNKYLRFYGGFSSNCILMYTVMLKITKMPPGQMLFIKADTDKNWRD